jgi:hypothetical protein
MNEFQVLVLVAPDSRREDIIDALMSLPAISGFTLAKAMGFSAEHSHFNLRGQVEGCRAFSRFEVVFAPAVLPSLLEALSAAVGSETLRYWVIDVPDCGHLPLAVETDTQPPGDSQHVT